MQFAASAAADRAPTDRAPRPRGAADDGHVHRGGVDEPRRALCKRPAGVEPGYGRGGGEIRIWMGTLVKNVHGHQRVSIHYKGMSVIQDA